MNEKIVYTAEEINNQISHIFVDDKIFHLMGGYPQPIDDKNEMFWSPAYGEDNCHYDLYWKMYVDTQYNCEYYQFESYNMANL